VFPNRHGHIQKKKKKKKKKNGTLIVARSFLKDYEIQILYNLIHIRIETMDHLHEDMKFLHVCEYIDMSLNYNDILRWDCECGMDKSRNPNMTTK
jgi:hypothetical protein